MTELVETAPHEFVANYNFAGGLNPYFAFDRIVKGGGGSVEAEFIHDGESWSVQLYYQDSNIVHPGDTTPTGTRFNIEEIREFRLSVEAVHDDTGGGGQRDFNVHFRPRWTGMEVENEYGETNTLSVPFEEGINARVTGSNIEFSAYLSLIQRAAHALDVKWSYFDDPHDSSNVQQAERYVRLILSDTST